MSNTYHPYKNVYYFEEMCKQSFNNKGCLDMLSDAGILEKYTVRKKEHIQE